MHLFWQNTVELELQVRIMEFAATTMGDVYLLSQTCKQWDEILNQDPDTADPIWHRMQRNIMGLIDDTSGNLRNYGFCLQT